MNFQAAMNNLDAGQRVSRSPWANAYALPYLTKVNRSQFEIQTRSAAYGTTPASTSAPAPYMPAQIDMTAIDWMIVYPDILTLGGLAGNTGKFWSAVKTLEDGTPAVGRAAWVLPGQMPYLALATRSQIEMQTKTKTSTTPPTYNTSGPSPYSPSQADLAASDWITVTPEAFL